MVRYEIIKAKEAAYKKRLLKVNNKLNENSGIYILTREYAGFKFAYIGQAKHILTRLAQHLMRFEQHIDKSLAVHGLYSETNKEGWKVDFIEYDESLLNEKEQEYILKYANAGYQLRNKTAGSQSNGKIGINDNKTSKGYRDGVKKGKFDAIKSIRNYFDKYLNYVIKGKPTKIKIKKMEEFSELLEGTENGIKDD